MREFLTAIWAGLMTAAAIGALVISFTHSGPAGAQGPPGPRGSQGDAGRSATSARLGVCWSYQTFTQTWSDGSSDTWVSGVQVSPAVYSGGVYSCPNGESFVSIVPQPSSSG